MYGTQGTRGSFLQGPREYKFRHDLPGPVCMGSFFPVSSMAFCFVSRRAQVMFNS